MDSDNLVGFIGVGKIGRPMVERLAGQEWPVLAYARRSEVRQELQLNGIRSTNSITQLAESCDRIIVCLYDDTQLSELTLGDSGLVDSVKPGTVVASHTTGSPATLGRIAAAASARDVFVVEAPFSGSADVVRGGELTVFLSGDASAIERIEQPLRSYCRHVIKAGEPGAALKVKLVNNALFAAHSHLATDAVRISDELGIERSVLFEALAVSSGGSTAMKYLSETRGVDDFVAQIGSYLRKDLAICESLARELSVELGAIGSTSHGGPLSLRPEP
ncbi:NAD(P)-dependent oxidoreductase [Rhodococcus sp. NPDC059968]|uniref:NAD(P)-dependent oxidoreductase n=1 Tax=Rhodococcus sp. NPDC059968 TaxID=3347017 RepID=UPI00366F9F87